MCKSNIDKIKEEAEKLRIKGEILMYSFANDYGTQAEKDYAQKKGGGNLPAFSRVYQTWYSQSYRLIKQILPERAKDFSNLYEYPRERKEITVQNYTIKDALQGLRIGSKAEPMGAFPELTQQVSIVNAACSILVSAIADIISTLQSNVFDSEIESAKNLKKAGHLRAAGAICGVMIEKHLLSVCRSHNININKKTPSISDLNEKLKSEKILEHTQWRHIQLMADIRNICSHAKGREPTNDQIEDLINGTDKIIKSIF